MKKLLPFLFLACCSIVSAQDTIRVCTYNVLNYSQTNEDGRAIRFERILGEIKPDILVAQEIVDETSAVAVADAMFYGLKLKEVGLSVFNNGKDTDNMIYYKTDKVEFVEAPVYHKTALRDIAEYRFGLINTGDTIYIFSVHLKSADTDEDALARQAEVAILKSKFPTDPNAKIFVVGDFNFYAPTEPGYLDLTSNFPPVVDPLGTWVRNSTEYLDYYTQSPRVAPNAGCGGGTGGGMDDRFDFIFHSLALGNNLVYDSYTVFGNDGADRRDAPINAPTNTRVSKTIADDLQCASDHLPVYADFIFSKTTSVAEDLSKGISFKETGDNFSISLPSPGSVTVTDILGRILLKENVDDRWNLNRSSLQRGIYFIQVAGFGTSKQFKFIVAE